MQPKSQRWFDGAEDFNGDHGGDAAGGKAARTRKRSDLCGAPPGFRPRGQFRRPGRCTTGEQPHGQPLHAARKGKCGKPRRGDQRNGAADGERERRQNAGLTANPV